MVISGLPSVALVLLGVPLFVGVVVAEVPIEAASEALEHGARPDGPLLTALTSVDEGHAEGRVSAVHASRVEGDAAI